ncbi:TPA: hypothetical protein J9715_001602 [Escherichia coli]|uniref:hypothetical protein n=1 Tax=Escherichia coli TaxID=562 RepID=UPI000A4D90DA|nr:hypothetical protein [Escherichia coli]HAZ7531982.1 hypothetical protein [Escherichia coli]HBB2625335.1 hypothetical protein [Escherichia coli]
MLNVFPASAGINRQWIETTYQITGVPRVSGDKPEDISGVGLRVTCSPRQRG